MFLQLDKFAEESDKSCECFSNQMNRILNKQLLLNCWGLCKAGSFWPMLSQTTFYEIAAFIWLCKKIEWFV